MSSYRRFPNRFTPSSSQQDPAILLTLGRRVERLFFIGLLITMLSFAGWYFNAASASITQDRSYAAIASLSARIKAKLQELDRSFQETVTRDRAPPSNSPPSGDKKLAAVAATRKMLNLPAEVIQPEKKRPVEKTYRQVLEDIFIEAQFRDGVDSDSIDPYRQFSEPPAKILEALEKAGARLDQQPVQAWGIRTARSLELSYYGSAFQLPFQFIAQVIVVLLCPLVAGWMSTLYMTRQREIQEIKGVTDLAHVFPHVLNFVPIHFQNWGVLTPAGLTFSAIWTALRRLLVIIVLIAPMLVATTGAVVAFWQYSTWTWVTIPFLIYIPVQALALIALESFSMGRKYFAEP
ncbi:MAG TPA: hypothetical protein VJ753_04840 [Rhizomicrobium sp.]|nr:hypothetical protein [Rhizomicrobium sp.]